MSSRPAHALRTLILCLIVLALSVLAPGTAIGGGPTSVLLASPSAQSAAGLYYDDADYSSLLEMLGGYTTPTAAKEQPPTSGGSYVTATWLVHDVMVWRIDRIFFTAGQGVWVVSQVNDPGELKPEGMFPGETGPNAIWHRPAEPAALTDLLAKHGLVAGGDGLDAGILVSDQGGSTGSGAAGLGSADQGSAAAAEDMANTAASSSIDPAAGNRTWTFALGGLLTGLLVAGGVFWMLRIRDRARAAIGSPHSPEDQPPVPMLPA